MFRRGGGRVSMGPTGPGSMSAISRGPNQGQASGTPGQPSGMQRSALGTTQLGQDAMLGQASKRRRPAIDRHLPLFFPQDNGPTKESDEVLANLRESYTSLEALEKKMDWTISRKRAEYSDLTGRSGTQMGQSKSKMGGVRRTLRLWLSHEIHTNSTTQESTQDQPENNDSTEQKEDNGSNDTVDKEQPESTEAATESQHKDPSWTLKLTGLLQQNEDEEKTHLSSLLSQLVVEVAPQDTPNQQRIEWSPSPGASPLDGLTLSRPLTSDTQGPLKLRLSISLDQHPERYKLAEPVGKQLDIYEETRSGCLLALWAYIKKHELQENDDRQRIKCDHFLAMLCGRQPGQSIYFYNLGEYMARWLQRPDPITLEYELDTAASSSVSTVYDIDMTVADPALSHIDQFLRGIVSQSSAITDIVQSDLQLAQSCSKAKAVKARRDVCAAFASDPIGFIFDFLESQSIDLDAYLNQNAEKGALAQTTSMWGMPNLEDMRRAEFWSQGWTEEGVRLISQRQLVSASLQANAAARQHYGRR